MTLSQILEDVLGALGIVSDSVVAKAQDLATAYPDAAEALANFTTWFQVEVQDQMSAEKAAETAAAIWAEIQSGHPGENPHHGMGA